MRKPAIFIGLTLLMTVSSYALDSSKDNFDKKFTKTIELESMKIRSQKKYNFNFGTAVAVEEGTLASLEASYHLNELEDISIALTRFDSLYSNTEHLRAKGYILTTYYKYYFGNSFYLKPGLYYKDQETTITNDISSSTVIENLSAVGLDLRIGNQWQWEHFSFGIDWVGQSVDFHNFSINRRQRKETNSFFIALNIYIGVTF